MTINSQRGAQAGWCPAPMESLRLCKMLARWGWPHGALPNLVSYAAKWRSVIHAPPHGVPMVVALWWQQRRRYKSICRANSLKPGADTDLLVIPKTVFEYCHTHCLQSAMVPVKQCTCTNWRWWVYLFSMPSASVITFEKGTCAFPRKWRTSGYSSFLANAICLLNSFLWLGRECGGSV